MPRLTYVDVSDKESDEIMTVKVAIGFSWNGKEDDDVYYYFENEDEFESAKSYASNFEFWIVKD